MTPLRFSKVEGGLSRSAKITTCYRMALTPLTFLNCTTGGISLLMSLNYNIIIKLSTQKRLAFGLGDFAQN